MHVSRYHFQHLQEGFFFCLPHFFTPREARGKVEDKKVQGLFQNYVAGTKKFNCWSCVCVRGGYRGSERYGGTETQEGKGVREGGRAGREGGG